MCPGGGGGWGALLSKDSPHAAPELLTRTCRPRSPSRLVNSVTRALHASRDCRSAGRATALPPDGFPGGDCQQGDEIYEKPWGEICSGSIR